MPSPLRKCKFRSIFGRTPSDEFLRWANADEAAGPRNLIVYGREDLENARGRKIPEEAQLVSDPDRLREELKQRSDLQRRDLLILDQPPGKNGITRLFCFEDKYQAGKIRLGEMRVRSDTHRFDDLDLCNVAIRRLVLPGEMSGRTRITDCWIEVLQIIQSKIHLDIIRSDIAHIDLRQSTLREWSIRDSSIGSVDMSGEGQIGDVRFHNLKTPRGTSWYRKTPPSPEKWHSVKKALATGGNEWAAGIFHATEMSIRSREDASGLVKRIGRFYEDACDYGNSVSKPILWLVFWFILSLFIYSGFDLTAPSVVADDAVCVGWVERLCGAGGGARFGRVLYLAAQPVLNPLAGVMGSSLVVPDLPAYLYSIFHRIMSFVLIFLSIVAIRRRFRIKMD